MVLKIKLKQKVMFHSNFLKQSPSKNVQRNNKLPALENRFPYQWECSWHHYDSPNFHLPLAMHMQPSVKSKSCVRVDFCIP